jgi:hypothetical protein
MSKLFPSSRQLAAEARCLPTVEGQLKPRELMALVRGKVRPQSMLTNSRPIPASSETTQATHSLSSSGSLFNCSEFVLHSFTPRPLMMSIMSTPRPSQRLVHTFMDGRQGSAKKTNLSSLRMTRLPGVLTRWPNQRKAVILLREGSNELHQTSTHRHGDGSEMRNEISGVHCSDA